MKIEIEIPDKYEVEAIIPVMNLTQDSTESISVILRPQKRKVIKFVEDANGLYVLSSMDRGFYMQLALDEKGTPWRQRYTRIETTE